MKNEKLAVLHFSHCMTKNFIFSPLNASSLIPSRSQQALNNLGKSSVIACVALAGYSVVFKAKEKEIDEVEPEAEKPKEIQGKAEVVPSVLNPNGSSYSSNASNVLANNSSLASVVSSLVNAEPVSPGEDAGEQAKPIKTFSKYTVTGSPQNIVVKSILDILLTPFIANKLSVEPEHEVLKTLTQNTRNPYLIWDNATRTQLLDFLEYQRQNSSKEQSGDITDIYNKTSKFVYDATRDELKIGGVYIRIYNEMPTFPIQNPKMFVLDLLEYLKQAYIHLNGTRTINHPSNQSSPKKIGVMQAPLIPTPVKPNQKNLDNILNDYNRSKMKNQLEKNENGSAKISYDFAGDQKFVDHLIMTLNSLISVIKLNPNVELQCIGNFDILFGLLNTNVQEQVSSGCGATRD
jgi:DnaJ homolog subfamily C member 13